MSVHFRRPRSVGKTDEERLEDARVNLSKYSKHVGIDPGVKNFVGMVEVNALNGETLKKKTISNGAYHYSYGAGRRKKKLDKWTRQSPIVQEYERLSSERSLKSLDWRDFVKFQLRYLRPVMKFKLQRKIRRLKWDSHMKRTQALDKLAHEIAKPLASNTKTLIAYGDGDMRGVRWYPTVPNKGLYKALQRNQNCDVFLVNEFMTTKTCSNCGDYDAMVLHSRFVYCRRCNLTLHRDKNAANNILKNLQYNLRIEEGERVWIPVSTLQQRRRRCEEFNSLPQEQEQQRRRSDRREYRELIRFLKNFPEAEEEPPEEQGP